MSESTLTALQLAEELTSCGLVKLSPANREIERLRAENERLRAHSKRLEEALSSIDIYLSDTLSGRVNGDPATYKDWLIDGIREARNRARTAYNGQEEKGGE